MPIKQIQKIDTATGHKNFSQISYKPQNRKRFAKNIQTPGHQEISNNPIISRLPDEIKCNNS